MLSRCPTVDWESTVCPRSPMTPKDRGRGAEPTAGRVVKVRTPETGEVGEGRLAVAVAVAVALAGLCMAEKSPHQ